MLLLIYGLQPWVVRQMNSLSVLYKIQQHNIIRIMMNTKVPQSSGSLLFSAHHRPACSASTPVRATLQTRWDDASSSVDLFRGSGTSVTNSGKVMKFALRSKNEGRKPSREKINRARTGPTREDSVHVHSQG